MGGTHECNGKVAWVTGAGQGIGRAIAIYLAAAGAAVLVSGRDEKRLGRVVGEIVYGGGRARHVVADVGDPAALLIAAARAVESFGSLDIVVANAGISSFAPLDADDLTAAKAVLDTNLFGTYATLSAAARTMTGPGKVIAIGSVLGKFGTSLHAAYCASKAGVAGLVRAAAVELAPRGITVNTIAPGWVETDMAQHSIAHLAAQLGVSEDEAKRRACADVPLGRFLEPEDIARFVVFLAGRGGDGITGQHLSICGGATAFGS